MDNMIKLHDRFAGYEAVEKLSIRHDGEREVYAAVDQEGRKVTLTVFDLKSKRYASADSDTRRLPECIEEVRFMKDHHGIEGLPAFLESGIEDYDDRSYAWMTQEYVEGESLHSLIRRLGNIGIQDALDISGRIGKVVEKVALFTKGGGHYNISTANILVRQEEGAIADVRLIGFANIGESSLGSHRIDASALDRRFQAPESIKGIFNSKTDVYALGMVTVAMTAGYPTLIQTDGYTIDYGAREIDMEEITSSDFRKALWKSAEERLPQALKLILRKATDPLNSARFVTTRKFIDFLDRLDGGKRKTDAKSERSEDTAKPAEVTLGKSGNASVKESFKTQEKIGSDSHAMDAVAGMEELKNLFRRDFIRIVRNPKVAQAYGIKPSNCTLLYGPQGCGKTFIAEKAAQESGLKYRVVNPSELGSIYVHGSQQKIAELFEEAEKKAPMILIFDEFDALVPKRDSELNANQANEVNEMLTQLNNCAARGIYVLATTNRPTLLDPAIMRKGRVDRTVYVSLPDKEARKALFRMELEKRPHEAMDYDRLAEATAAHTCSDITYMVEETARMCFEETLENG
ncbi:MAG: AAA family ATPase, partial [Muribaculaceae bacterium]|nr:AAA family ATPase [Muribaculaceae bacterium]